MALRSHRPYISFLMYTALLSLNSLPGQCFSLNSNVRCKQLPRTTSETGVCILISKLGVGRMVFETSGTSGRASWTSGDLWWGSEQDMEPSSTTLLTFFPNRSLGFLESCDVTDRNAVLLVWDVEYFSLPLQDARQEGIRGLIKGNSTTKADVIRLHKEVWIYFSNPSSIEGVKRKAHFVLRNEVRVGYMFLNACACLSYVYFIIVQSFIVPLVSLDSVGEICSRRADASVCWGYHCSQQATKLHFPGGQAVRRRFTFCSGPKDCWRVSNSSPVVVYKALYLGWLY